MTRRHLAAVVTAALAVGLAAPAAGTAAAGPVPSLAAVRAAVIDAQPVRPDLPVHPAGALAAAVRSLGSTFGFALDVAGRISAAHVPDEILGRLAVLTETLSECYVASAPARAAVARFGVPAEGNQLSAVEAAAFTAAALPIGGCAAKLESFALETTRYLKTHPQSTDGAMDFWPVLRYAPGDSADVVENDYLLSVDQGGNDTYLNNAG
jgi:hypothetical protein